MRINLREGSLAATLTESGATLLRFRLVTKGDEQKVRDAQKEAQTAKERAAIHLTEYVAALAREERQDEASDLERIRLEAVSARATAEADRLWHTQPTGRCFCLEGQQIDTAIQMCRGTFKSPCGEVGLADGYRHIRFYPDGIRIFGDSDSECSIEFPGPVMANAIDAVRDNLETLIKSGIPQTVNESHPSGKAQSFTTTVELTRDFVRDLEKGYAPWVEWAYNDYTGIDGYPPMHRKISEDRQDSRVNDRTLT
jgi:hypothetical protein